MVGRMRSYRHMVPFRWIQQLQSFTMDRKSLKDSRHIPSQMVGLVYFDPRQMPPVLIEALLALHFQKCQMAHLRKPLWHWFVRTEPGLRQK